MGFHQLPLSLWERGKGEGPPGEGMRVRAGFIDLYLNSKVFHGDVQHK
jgi:hypothetical protein